MFRFLSAGTALPLLLAAPAMAQTDSTDTQMALGEIVVTARSMARATDNVLTSVDILGGDVAQDQNVDDAWELFARLPGVVLTDFGQGTTSGRFSIRGFNGEGEINAVKLLIDGIPSNDNAGRMDFIDLVAPLDIASVELVRGTADPRWGLHAIAGSADIRTRSGGDYVDVRALAGSFGTRDVQLTGGVETGRLSQNYVVAHRTSEGFRDHAAMDRLRFAGKWRLDLDDARVTLIARHARTQGQEPGYLTDGDAYTDRRRSYAVSASDGGTREISQYGLTLDADLAPGLALTAIAYANRLHDNRYVRFSATVAQQQRLTLEDQQGLVGALHWHASRWLMVEAGGDMQWQDNVSRRWTTRDRIVTAATRDQDYALDVGGGYVQAILTPLPWLKVTPAWRFDRVGGTMTDALKRTGYRINDYGTIGQPKLSVALTPIPGITAYGNFGRTFQIGAGSGAYVVPPRVRDLAPSINDGYEAGIKLARGHWLTARAAIWRQTASGELRRRLNDPAGEFDNLGQTRRDGVDVELSIRPVAGWSLWGSWSHQRAVVQVPDPASPALAGNAIDHVPANVYTAGVEWRPDGPVRASLWTNGQSSYELNPANDRGRYGANFQLTAEVAWAVVPWAELGVQLRNLTDARNEYVWFDGTQRLHAPGDPRGGFVSLRLRS